MTGLTAYPSHGPATPKMHTTPSTTTPTPAPQPAALTSVPASMAKSAYHTWAPTVSPTPTARYLKRIRPATSTSATSSATRSPSSVPPTAPPPAAPSTSSAPAPRALAPCMTVSATIPRAPVGRRTQARIRTTRVLGPGVTPVRHRTHSSLLALAPRIPTLTMTVRLSDRPRARFNAVLALLVAVRAERAMGSGETTSQPVTHRAKLVARLVSGVSLSGGGARKSKLALAFCKMASGCAFILCQILSIALEYMFSLNSRCLSAFRA